ncbi:MAG: hypothetical protein AXA67_02110 [Methylothermaceae bacteria B42]|nr:MAG: hypothetical protein AXA67_02110 [Methylothermaceae bacteria B42]HHJ40056.1 hypothetical protein [Methylothermaceae bacterium]
MLFLPSERYVSPPPRRLGKSHSFPWLPVAIVVILVYPPVAGWMLLALFLSPLIGFGIGFLEGLIGTVPRRY